MFSLQALGAITPDPEFEAFPDRGDRERLRQALDLVSRYHGYVFVSPRGTSSIQGGVDRDLIAGCYELPHIVVVGSSRVLGLNQLLDLSLDFAVAAPGVRLPSPLPDDAIPNDLPGQTSAEWFSSMRRLGKITGHDDGASLKKSNLYAHQIREVMRGEDMLPGLALLVECDLQARFQYRDWTLSAITTLK